MIYNTVGFLILPFLLKTRIPVAWLGNTFVFFGASAIIVLTYFSGGVWSAIYPWIIAIPVLALLVVNRLSGAVWGIISFAFMLWFAALAIQGNELPMEYDNQLHKEWYVTILPGLLLIILFISFVFENNLTKALKELSTKNEILKGQKATIADQSAVLTKLIEEKDFIIRILAHDLRNPLNNIKSLVDLTRMEKSPNHLEEYLKRIMLSSDSAINLVNKVLELDSIENENAKINLEKIDLINILELAVDASTSNATKKNITLSFKKSQGPVFVKADKTYLGLIFENLLSNAIKFSQEGAAVEIEWSVTGSTVQVKIRDQGPGIHPDERERLFRKFSRLSARPTGGETTIGLGLALVMKYVSMMGGKVWHEDPKEKGAIFIVELPLST